MDKRRARRECQQQDQRDCGQSPVGDWRALALRGSALGAMPTSMEKAMPEGPVLRQIIPAIVLQFPPVMAQPSHQRGGKGLSI